jgi:hypothetical protein
MIEQEPGIVELVDTRDSRAVRNKNNVLGFYDLVINKKRSEESVAQFMAAASRSPKLKLDRWCCSLTLREPRRRLQRHAGPCAGDRILAGGNVLDGHSSGRRSRIDTPPHRSMRADAGQNRIR